MGGGSFTALGRQPEFVIFHPTYIMIAVFLTAGSCPSQPTAITGRMARTHGHRTDSACCRQTPSLHRLRTASVRLCTISGRVVTTSTMEIPLSKRSQYGLKRYANGLKRYTNSASVIIAENNCAVRNSQLHSAELARGRIRNKDYDFGKMQDTETAQSSSLNTKQNGPKKILTAMWANAWEPNSL